MPAPLELRPGTLLRGQYLVDRELRSDSLAVVVQATRKSDSERVALKVLRPESAQRRDLARTFLEQGRAAARLKCEHAVRVFEVGELDSGEPYLAMEYLRGTDLARLVAERGPLPSEQAVDYCLQACAALAEAHAWGLVHGEVKPNKLFLATGSDGLARIKLLELGQRSHPGADARGDVMAVGVVLQYLLSGAVASEHSLPGFPAALQVVISGCLQKDAARRFPDVLELAQALDPFRDPTGLGSAETVASVAHSAMKTLPPGMPSPYRDASLEPTAPELLAASVTADKPGPPVPIAQAATLLAEKPGPPLPTAPELKAIPAPAERPGPPVATLLPGNDVRLSNPGVARPGAETAPMGKEAVLKRVAAASPAPRAARARPGVALTLVALLLASVLAGLAAVLVWRRFGG